MPRPRRADCLHGLPGDLNAHFPAAPILARLYGDTPLSDAGFTVGHPMRRLLEKSIARARRDGFVTAYTADQLCVHVLKVHPVMVYGDTWWDGTLDDHLGAAS